MKLKSIMKVSIATRTEINIWKDKNAEHPRIEATIDLDYGCTDHSKFANALKQIEKYGDAEVSYISVNNAKAALSVDAYLK